MDGLTYTCVICQIMYAYNTIRLIFSEVAQMGYSMRYSIVPLRGRRSRDYLRKS